MTTGHSAPNTVKSRIARTMGKAAIFSEALPFIKRFRGATIVIKYGGSAMVNEDLRETFADDVAMLHFKQVYPLHTSTTGYLKKAEQMTNIFFLIDDFRTDNHVIGTCQLKLEPIQLCDRDIVITVDRCICPAKFQCVQVIIGNCDMVSGGCRN